MASTTATRSSGWRSRVLATAWSSAGTTTGGAARATVAAKPRADNDGVHRSDENKSGSFRGAAWPSSPSCLHQGGRLASGCPRRRRGFSSALLPGGRGPMRVQFGDLALDRDARQLLRGEQEVRLGPKAFDLRVLL